VTIPVPAYPGPALAHKGGDQREEEGERTRFLSVAHRQRIAYWAYRRASQRDVDDPAEGGPPVAVTAARWTEPMWSPDGRWLYFGRDHGGHEPVAVDGRGVGNPQAAGPLTGGGISWPDEPLSDGRRFACTEGPYQQHRTNQVRPGESRGRTSQPVTRGCSSHTSTFAAGVVGVTRPASRRTWRNRRTAALAGSSRTMRRRIAARAGRRMGGASPSTLRAAGSTTSGSSARTARACDRSPERQDREPCRPGRLTALACPSCRALPHTS
jgi:hypothetical protein